MASRLSLHSMPYAPEAAVWWLLVLGRASAEPGLFPLYDLPTVPCRIRSVQTYHSKAMSAGVRLLEEETLSRHSLSCSRSHRVPYKSLKTATVPYLSSFGSRT